MEINEKNKKKEQQALIIRKYQQYLKLEKSLSPNTLDAYLTDLDKLMNFLTLEGIDVLEVCLSDLQRFAAGLHDIGIHPRSQARILSGIKSFFRFLIMADYLEADPSELLEGPKIGLKLPEVLTVEEIDNIISSVDRSKAEGQRNRAILETLYSCGLRVSELVSLKLSDLYFDEGFIKVEGKGSKQRLVPISPRAINEIDRFAYGICHSMRKTFSCAISGYSDHLSTLRRRCCFFQIRRVSLLGRFLCLAIRRVCGLGGFLYFRLLYGRQKANESFVD